MIGGPSEPMDPAVALPPRVPSRFWIPEKFSYQDGATFVPSPVAPGRKAYSGVIERIALPGPRTEQTLLGRQISRII